MRTDNIRRVKHLLLCMEGDIAYIESKYGTRNLYGIKSNLKKLHEAVNKIIVREETQT